MIAFPPAARTARDRLGFAWRAAERMRLWHNDQARALDLPAFRAWERQVWRPRYQVVLAALNGLRDQRLAHGLNDPRNELGIAAGQAAMRDGVRAVKWDKGFDPQAVAPLGAPAPEPPDPTEDYQTYAEVDAAGDITVDSATQITFDTMGANVESHVTKDQGAGHFDGDFEHHNDAQVSATSGSGAQSRIWGLANAADSMEDIDAASGDAFYGFMGQAGANRRIAIVEIDGGAAYQSAWDGFTLSQRYYYKWVRDEAVGTYGTLYCYVYDDAPRTNLVATPTLTLHTSKKDFRFIFALHSKDTSDADTATGDVQNLDLNEAAGIPIFADYYRRRRTT